MFLMRAFLDPTSREVRADLKSPEGLHKTVMRAFPDHVGPSPRRELGVLHRLDEDRDRLVLLVQSRVRPSVDRWPAGYLLKLGDDVDWSASMVDSNPAVRDLATERARIEAGDRFMFRLVANTTKKIATKSGPDGERKNGTRVPVRGDDERIQWFDRHATASGFGREQGTVRITEVAPRGRGGAKGLTFAGALFEGSLRVNDAVAFRAALDAGIGPAKAYGFGLLSVRRVA